MKRRAEAILAEPVSKYKAGDLLETSRTVLKRLYILGFMYRLGGDKRYLSRAKSEMMSVCSFPNWHPEHFLDTAEMTQALAIGYDWFYDALSESERLSLVHAITELGLKPGLKAEEERKELWVNETHSNWCLVCYGGLLTGALALGADSASDAKLDESIFSASVNHLRQSLAHFAPDGAWVEGLGYWNYGSMYATTAIACLETAIGNDGGLAKVNGFERAGLFFVDCIGPTGSPFDFADAEPTVRNSPQLFWFASRYNLPVLAYYERELLRTLNKKIDPRDLIWFNPSGSGSDLEKRPLVSTYRGATQLVTMRTGWHQDDSFVAFKGGDNTSHHAHLELGTFVFDRDGVRWVSQLGVENYDLPGYFENRKSPSSKRWTYYRCATAGQNTVVVNHRNQDTSARAYIVDAQDTDKSPENQMLRKTLPDFKDFELEELDMSEAYKSLGIDRYTRTFALSRSKQGPLLVIDTINDRTSVQAVWQVHTNTDVRMVGDSAFQLKASGKSMRIEVLEPRDAKLSVDEVSLAAPQYKSNGVKRLAVRGAQPAKSQRFVVLFTSADDELSDDWRRRVEKWLHN
ncbi:MAG TPA: heparinase II/III family protein [Oculatellaceae cyanobacterium]